MPERDLPLSVTLEAVEGHQARTTTDLERWSIDTQYLVPTDGFEFELFETDQGIPAALDNRPVTLTLDGKQQLVGRIEITEVGGNGSSVTCRGRDYLADLVECNVDPTFKLRDEMTIGSMLLDVCGPCGITTIIDETDTDFEIRELRAGVKPKRTSRRRRRPKGKGKATDPLKEYQPRPGEGIYEYVNRVLARASLTIQPGPNRQTLILTRPAYDQEPLYTIRRYRDPTLNSGNNIQEARAVRDYSRVPSFALLTGTAAKAGKQGQPIFQEVDVYAFAGITINGQSAGGGSQEALEVIGRTMQNARIKPGPAPEPEEGKPTRPLYRLLYFRDDEARSQEQLACAATRAIAERLKDTLAYRVTLRGHTDPETGAIWTVDTMVNVQDEICGVNEPLWIAKRTLSFSPEEGATTQLECWRPGSFPFVED